jgi:hypothetical protein
MIDSRFSEILTSSLSSPHPVIVAHLIALSLSLKGRLVTITIMVSPVVVWVCMLLGGSTLVLQQFVKPRLPIYKLRVLDFPALQWIRGCLHTRLRTDVSLHNDNYVQIDVHALSFDVFYSDWSGDLTHIGSIQDKHQIGQLQLAHQQLPATTSTTRTTTPSFAMAVAAPETIRKQKKSKEKKKSSRVLPSKEPLWQIQPRANFSITDDLYLAPSIRQMLCTLPSLIRGLWRGGGTSLIVPTTGVAHIKASSSAPFTVSIVCDNLVDTWSMQILGFDCALRQLHPGWLDLEQAVESLRGHALTLSTEDGSGGVLPYASHSSATWSKVLKILAWEDTLQRL